MCGEEFSNPNKKFEPSPANEFATGLIVGEYQQGETSKSSVFLPKLFSIVLHRGGRLEVVKL